MLNDGESLTDQISNSMNLVTESIKGLGKDVNSQKRSVEYHANILNQFVENGYEVYTERVPLPNWWEKLESTSVHKIFFQRDYSSRPHLFFGVSQFKKFTISQAKDDNIKKNVILSVSQKEVMTSYFSVEIKVELNAHIEASEAMRNYPPDIYITYVLLNRRD